MNKLKLEHLAPYLPYGLNIYDMGIDDILSKLTIDNISFTLNNLYEGSMLKVVLRPLSDLTLDWLRRNIDADINDFRVSSEKGNFSVEVCDEMLGWTALSYPEYTLFLKNHFDIFGLIDKKLAIDINTLNENND